MKILIIAGTGSGCALETATVMAEELTRLGHEVLVKNAKDSPSPEGYGAVFAGSGVRAGKWHKSLRSWMKQHAPALRGQPLAVFTICLMMRNPEKHTKEILAISDGVLRQLDLTPVSTGLFPGWFFAERFGVMERLILKLMKTPRGDFRDLDAIRTWTRETAGKLTPG
ncbi:flavodoxin domain-containing protein [Myxococcota bacterium]|nr:flavodoxin domain-containing protein [Myxococcota bacterium]MBU1411978.1 flavodoxin domain-containing protein [Myxococcota bacterium]MBU1511109.1 flavodoxin domain-containing protein [Myxococcota bacterium]